MDNMHSPLDALKHWEESHPDQVYLRQPIAGEFQEFTWAQVAEQVRKVAGFIESLDLPEKSCIAILSKNCAHWFIADLAIMMAGHISIPIYATANGDTISYILAHCEAKAIFVGKLDEWQVQEAAIPKDLRRIALPYDSMPAEHQWHGVLSCNQAIKKPASPKPEDTMSIIYTSGSTGRPKGVEITYRAYMCAAQNLKDFLQVGRGDSMFSYLPLAHITERVFIQGISLLSGLVPVSFVESLGSFSHDLQRVQPTLFISVPRLWVKFQMAVFERVPSWLLNILLAVPLVSYFIKRKIRIGMGLNRARVVGSGSAPVSPSLLRWYQKLGINITEAWGMTENLAYGTLNYPFNPAKIGTIGRPAPGLDIKLGEDGEMLVRSSAMLKGYYLEPAQTEAAMQDGYFCTGDKGEIDSEGYVTITGRVKDIFKTAKGKYITPVPIENCFADNPDIEQICVVGSSLKQPVALLVLSEAAQLKERDIVAWGLLQTLRQVNLTLESHQKLDRLIVVQESWDIENGLLTPTLKFKRHLIEQRYKHLWAMETTEQLIWQ